MTDYDVIIAEWYEDITIPLAPEPVLTPEPIVYARPMQKPYHIPFMGGKGRRDLNARPPMQYSVTDKKRKGYDAPIFDRLDTVLDIVGHDLDNPILSNDKPVYAFVGSDEMTIAKRAKIWKNIDKHYKSLETK